MNRLWLLILLTWSSYGYSWICYYQPDSNGYISEGSLNCSGIETADALENHWCVYYQPSDPICEQFKTVCVNSVEYRTEDCPINHSGGLQQSRQFTCSTQTWSDWQTSSNNCTPNPPSCIETSESRVLQCDSGYEGQITETRISSCPDPYGEPQWLDWHQTEYGCTQSVSDPVSPISVTSPTNPVSPTAIESATAPQVDVQSPSPLPVQKPTEPIAKALEEVNDNSTEKSEKTEDVEEAEQETTENKIQDLPKGEQEVVHGFGLSLSLDLFNNPMQFYQPPLVDPFTIIQEFPIDEATRKFQLDLLKQDNIENYYFSDPNNTWDRLRRGDILQ